MVLVFISKPYFNFSVVHYDVVVTYPKKKKNDVVVVSKLRNNHLYLVM